MKVNKRQFFCQQYAQHLYFSEWSFTTLLAASINSITPLPDNMDSVIHQLLLTYPHPPPIKEIRMFLLDMPLVDDWFKYPDKSPTIRSFNLDRENTHFANPQLPELTSPQELAQWLEINEGTLIWLSDLLRRKKDEPTVTQHYHYHCIEKRRGGLRFIESPKKRLKKIQRQIAEQILICAPAHANAHSFKQGESCIDHARHHCRKKYLYLFDLAHCFQSITWPAIFRVFLSLGYPRNVAIHLSHLCSHRCDPRLAQFKQLDPAQRDRLKQRHLPQGAPSSPALSNAIMLHLDKRLSGYAKSLGLNYSRYADDLAFSGDKYYSLEKLETRIGAICLEQGFELNYRKSRLLTQSHRQKLTGIVVNQKPNIDRRDYDALKAILHNCVRTSPEHQNREKHPNFKAHLWGRIQYMRHLNPQRGAKLVSLFRQIKFCGC